MAVFNSALTNTVPSLNTAPLTFLCSVFEVYTFFKENFTKTTQDTRSFYGALAIMLHWILSSKSTFNLQRIPTVGTAIPLSSLTGTPIFSNNGFTFFSSPSALYQQVHHPFQA
jgi:hypothetical protein